MHGGGGGGVKGNNEVQVIVCILVECSNMWRAPQMYDIC